MKTWTAFIVVGLVAASLAKAEPPAYRVRNIHATTSTDLIKVGESWRKDLPKRMQATLRVQQETPAAAISVKAYFYDKDDHLIDSRQAPNEVWTRTKRGLESILLPVTLERNKDINVYFALPPELIAQKWKTILVVFGDAEKVAARSFPASALPDLDFPEKALLIEDKEGGN